MVLHWGSDVIIAERSAVVMEPTLAPNVLVGDHCRSYSSVAFSGDHSTRKSVEFTRDLQGIQQRICNYKFVAVSRCTVVQCLGCCGEAVCAWTGPKSISVDSVYMPSERPRTSRLRI